MIIKVQFFKVDKIVKNERVCLQKYIENPTFFKFNDFLSCHFFLHRYWCKSGHGRRMA